MVSYEPLKQTMLNKGVTFYQLSYKYGMNASTVQRLREGKNITLPTLEMLCEILDCSMLDVIAFVKEDDPEE